MILETGALAWAWSEVDKLFFAAGSFTICFLIFVAFILLNISDYLNNEQQRKNDLYYERLKKTKKQE